MQWRTNFVGYDVKFVYWHRRGLQRLRHQYEYLPSISQKIEPGTAVIVLSLIALQLARDEDMGPVTALLVTAL
jgi:hypothetical protein